jgi:RsiW-degrading membrane proteinase PrsW (M82 family)
MVFQDLILIVAAFAPGIVYLVLIARYDRYERGPRRHLVGVYVLGMFAVLPALLLEVALDELVVGPLLGPGQRVSTLILFCFLVVGPVEELCKFTAVRSIYEGPHFNDPLDGVVYAAAAAMGFASLENAFYVTQYGWETLWIRSVLAIPGHLLFSAMWGYELGRRRFGLGGNVFRGLVAAAFLHGLYDALLFSQEVWLELMVMPLLMGMVWLFRSQIRELWALARAYEAGVATGGRLLRCEKKHRFSSALDSCPQCQREPATLVCATCGRPATWRTSSCGHCGQLFLDEASRCERCREYYPPHLGVCPLCERPSGWQEPVRNPLS